MVRFVLLALLSTSALAQKFELSPGSPQVELFDMEEITLQTRKSLTGLNPFKDVSLTATFKPEGGKPIIMEGFCDSQDGRTYKIRFMPTQAGVYRYETHLILNGKTQTTKGVFTAVPSMRKGILRQV